MGEEWERYFHIPIFNWNCISIYKHKICFKLSMKEKSKWKIKMGKELNF